MTSAIRSLTNTVETKVIAAGAGGAGGGVFGTFLVWLLGVLVWHQSDAAAKAGDAIAAVPWPVTALVPFVVGGAGAFIAGYHAPHTNRVPGAHSTDTASADSVALTQLTSSLVSTATASPAAVAPMDGQPAITADSPAALPSAPATG